MIRKGAFSGLIGAVLAASALVLAPSVSAARLDPAVKAKAAKKQARSAGYFVAPPAAADARRAAIFEAAGQGYDGFRFTPSGGATGRAVTVAIRARSTGRVGQAAATLASLNAIGAGLEPSAYSLGASIGWKHFALSGDLARVNGGALPDDHQLADVGVSYAGRNWSTRLLLGTEHATDLRSRIGGPDAETTLDLGGTYSVTRHLERSGGVRYKSQVDHSDLTSDRRDSQSVYVGTAFKF